MVNCLQKTKRFRTSLEKMVGIEKKRILPTYAAQSFLKQYLHEFYFRQRAPIYLN